MGVGRSERGTADDKQLPDLWAVVGGKEFGGIVVRETVYMDSKELPERLSTGALISVKAKLANRLHYTLISGTGPQSGWVSIRMQCQDLVVRLVTAGAPKEDKNNKTENNKPLPSFLQAATAARIPMEEKKWTGEYSHDAMEKCLSEAKTLANYQAAIGATEPERKVPLELSKAVCLASQELMLIHAVLPKVQQQLRKAWEDAKHDPMLYEPVRRKVCLDESEHMLERMGIEKSWDGVCWLGSSYIKAMGNKILTCEDQLKRQIIMRWSQWPGYQKLVGFKTIEMQDWVTSLRDPEGAFCEATWGGFIGRWQFDEGHFEIVPINSKLRVVFVADSQVSRGELSIDDIWHRTLLSNGVSIRLRRSTTYLEVLMSLEGACGWSDDVVAKVLDAGELTSSYVLQSQTVDVVRRLAKTWSVEDASPPEDPELNDLVPKPLGQITCSASDARQGRLLECLRVTQTSFTAPAKGIIYVSKAGLWFDWWVLESMLAKGVRPASVHFIDSKYDEPMLRDSSMRLSPLGDMAAWCRAVGIRSFAHESLRTFVKRQPRGATLLVPGPYCTLDEAFIAMQDEGLAVMNSGTFARKGEEWVQL